MRDNCVCKSNLESIYGNVGVVLFQALSFILVDFTGFLAPPIPHVTLVIVLLAWRKRKDRCKKAGFMRI